MPIDNSWVEKNQSPENTEMQFSRLSDDSSESDTGHRSSPVEDMPMFGDGNSNNKRPREFDDDNPDDNEEDHQPPQKKVSDIGKRLMQKMGYSEGTGLGKHGQGRLQPVEVFNQKGRRGLGHNNVKLQQVTLKWDPSTEIVNKYEDMMWLSSDQDVPSEKEICYWMVLGPSKNTIDDETLFCDSYILEQVLNCKSIFDTLGKHEMRTARTRSNPFETIRGAFFQNRAAVKMANIDRACNFMFTNPKTLNKDEPLYFADVCAGPGGFSEYVLWRNKWHAKGFGFTLKESNDFKLDEFYAGSPETFHPYYGPKEDGNVYDYENQTEFKKLIMSQTKNQGVHFMMADGGFSVEGKENLQEILSKQLYLCQCLVALKIVRTGGHFVTKLFDLFTPFSVGLVYLMYRCFKEISIFKPNTSRPANSERYLICMDKLDKVDDVINYLDIANHVLTENKKDRDVLELVPLDTLQSDDKFYQYIKESNDSLGSKQVTGLLKIAAYCENTTLIEHRQSQMRRECLEYWELPNQNRIIPRNTDPESQLRKILGALIEKLYSCEAKVLTVHNANDTVLSPPCDWYAVLCDYHKVEGHTPTLYFGMGRTKVYRYTKGTWTRILTIELPPNTLVFAEMVSEYRGQFRRQRTVESLHIIDAWLLGGEDISDKYLPERHMLINKFCNALWKPNSNVYRVRCKELHSLDEDLTEKLKLESRKAKNGSMFQGHFPTEEFYSHGVNNDDEEPYCFNPHAVMFLKCTAKPWSLYLSRSTGHHYFFNKITNKNAYNDRRPPSAVSTFSTTYKERVVWHWLNDSEMDIKYLHDKIREKCPR